MIWKKSALMIFLILSISGCQHGVKVNIAKACNIGGQYDDINLGLSRESDIEAYQAALVIRKNEIKWINRAALQEAVCVNEIQKGLK